MHLELHILLYVNIIEHSLYHTPSLQPSLSLNWLFPRQPPQTLNTSNVLSLFTVDSCIVHIIYRSTGAIVPTYRVSYMCYVTTRFVITDITSLEAHIAPGAPLKVHLHNHVDSLHQQDKTSTNQQTAKYANERGHTIATP
jgi:hypothetical protein